MVEGGSGPPAYVRRAGRAWGMGGVLGRSHDTPSRGELLSYHKYFVTHPEISIV